MPMATETEDFSLVGSYLGEEGNRAGRERGEYEFQFPEGLHGNCFLYHTLKLQLTASRGHRTSFQLGYGAWL